MAMLAAICSLSQLSGFNFKLSVVHIEHGLRPADESCGDAEHVCTFCSSRKIDCHVIHVKPGKIASYAQRKKSGIEAAARFYRHKALAKEALRLGSETHILIAHTNDDMLEMALMRTLRGVGSAGLAAMPQKRGRLFRPLLFINRDEIIGYLNAKKISWRTDSTNTDDKFLRNRIRHKLVPLLNKYFPSWKSGITAFSQTQSLTADFLADEAKSRIKWETDLNFFITNEKNFFDQPQIIREEALFFGINAFGKGSHNKSIKRSVVRRFCEGSLKAADLGSVRISREKGKIFLSAVKKELFESGFSRLIRCAQHGR
jgi:tRNA(Ile)-lysidine synthase